jgi:hypothetical protein
VHPNDTLNGKLVNSEWEREDEKHLRNKFGYWRMVEERMVRAQIKAEGGNPDDVFEVSRRVFENHKNDPSLREQQEAKRASKLVIAGIEVKLPGANFTREELERIAEHFAGANDPVAQSIHAKATEALRDL